MATVTSHPVTSTAPSLPSAQLTTDQSGAYALMMQTLASWGLTALAPDLKNFIINGDSSPDTLALDLSQTAAYKQRFSANAARVKAGLRELTPAEYIANEEQYRNILTQYGMPKGFYDTTSDLDKWIAGDVSPAELQDRVQAAADLVYNSPPEAQQAWNQFYGGGQGGAIAAILDPAKAAPLVEQQVAAAQIGGAALAAGFKANAGSAQKYASEGVTLAQARSAYSQIAQRMPTDQSVGARFGMQMGQQQEEAATFEGDASALRNQHTLYAEEQSLFGGHGGGTVNTGDKGQNF